MIDAAIPGIVGLVLLLRPQFVFFGSTVTPDASKITLIRRLGAVLLVIAGVFLALGLMDR